MSDWLIWKRHRTRMLYLLLHSTIRTSLRRSDFSQIRILVYGIARYLTIPLHLMVDDTVQSPSMWYSDWCTTSNHNFVTKLVAYAYKQSPSGRLFLHCLYFWQLPYIISQSCKITISTRVLFRGWTKPNLTIKYMYHFSSLELDAGNFF